MFRQKTLLNTIGSFAKYDFLSCTIRGQFAYQFGDFGNNDRRGFGAYAFIDRNFKNSLWFPEITLGFVYLSGDDPNTSFLAEYFIPKGFYVDSADPAIFLRTELQIKF